MSGENACRQLTPEERLPMTATTMDKTARRVRSYSCVDARPKGGNTTTRLSVYARLPASCPYVGSFHYAPSAGNRAYSFFEDQIVPHREALRLHKIKTNPMTGNFHSRPGVYSKLHGLQNFREGLVSLEEGATMDAIVARIRSSLTGTPPDTEAAVAGATKNTATAKADDTAEDKKDAPAKDEDASAKKADKLTTWAVGTPHLPAQLSGEGRPQLGPRGHTLKGLRTPHSACDALSSAAALKETRKSEDGGKKAPAARRAAAPYSKFWEEVDTERGRFGTSVDDNALPASSQQSTAAGGKSAAVGGNMRAAAVAAGVRGVGKAGVNWGNHHHHHHHHHHHQPARSSEGERGLQEGHAAVDKEKLRQQYLLSARPNAAAAAQRAKIRIRVSRGGGFGIGVGNVYGQGRGGGNPYGRGNAHGRGYHSLSGGNVHGRGGIGSAAAAATAALGVNPPLLSHRSVPDAWVAARAAAAEQSGAATSGMRRSASSAHGWESHTLQAQQKTQEYIQGREDLAPDMRPDVVLDNELSLAYDVDVSDAGMLGAGAYGTVLAAVHRSTGRQVAIKTMLKKYLLSDAEKASVEREIEIQKRLVNNHVIRLYEIYQTPERIYLVVERAPCGSLEEFLYVRGRMTELDAKRVVRQLLDGLAYLHKSGVVHCDLKPANVLFSDIDQGNTAAAGDSGDRAGQPVTPRAQVAPPASLSGLVVKLCDFGHARKVPDCRYFKFTGDINKIPFHMFKHTGTEGFVAPEVLRSEPYGKAADMWSTGCMLHLMLTGRMPWIPSRACLQRPLSTSGHCWKNVSEPAKSLVEDLLTADQAFRADVEQATHHSWFEGIHHCARMPTSAPGVKSMSPVAPPLRGRMASVPAVFLSAERSLTPPRSEGVLSGDAAAGGVVGTGSSSDSAQNEEGREQEAPKDEPAGDTSDAKPDTPTTVGATAEVPVAIP